MNIIFCPMPLRTSSIVKHDRGTAVAAFLSRTFGGPGILQSSLTLLRSKKALPRIILS